MGDSASKTYRIRIALPDDTPLQPGMSIEANVVTREKADALVMPAEAAQGTAVYAIEGDRARRRTIAIGLRGPRMIEVLSGLAAGERVVVPFPSQLRNGARVRAVERQ
jgi:multidrug efflux pump subunit AcrA (membrane-fusion protein)